MIIRVCTSPPVNQDSDVEVGSPIPEEGDDIEEDFSYSYTNSLDASRPSPGNTRRNADNGLAANDVVVLEFGKPQTRGE